jgi:hypothetical protein
MVSKVDRLSTVVLFSKKSQLLQLVDCRFFVDFASSISVGKWQNSDKMASKSSKKIVKVNCRLRGRFEILQQLTFLEKVDHTVDFSKKNPTTVDFSKKNPATVDLSSKVDCRLQCLSYMTSPRTRLGRLRGGYFCVTCWACPPPISNRSENPQSHRPYRGIPIYVVSDSVYTYV